MSTMILSPAEMGRASRPVARPTSSVRLTRRGRLVVFLATLLTALALCFVMAAGSVATQEKGTPEPSQIITVGTGDTLWDIAAARADDGDVRSMVERIQRLNALDSAMVAAGQRLRVPTS